MNTREKTALGKMGSRSEQLILKFVEVLSSTHLVAFYFTIQNPLVYPLRVPTGTKRHNFVNI